MDSTGRFNTIRWLLQTALDDEEEYLYQGEMSSYARSYAADAASELDDLFRSSPPTPAEIEYCVAQLAQPERIQRGTSTKLLMRLRERSRPLLKALAHAADPQLRIFAIETASTSLNSYTFMPLYGTIDLEQQLLADPDENVRLAAIAATKQTIQHNADYVRYNLENDLANPMANLFQQFLALLDDPAAEVRAAAAKALGNWAAYAGLEALNRYIERENDPAAREALLAAKNLSDQ